MNAMGLHGLYCNLRQEALNDIKRGLQSAGVLSILEPVGVDKGDGMRPDNRTVFPFFNRRSLCWDATCTDSYANTNIYSSAVSVEHEAREIEERKSSLQVRARLSIDRCVQRVYGIAYL